MTENRQEQQLNGFPTASEILGMDAEQFATFQQRRAVIREIEQERSTNTTTSSEPAPVRAANIVRDSEGTHIRTRTVVKGGLTALGVAALIGASAFGGYMLSGDQSSPATSGSIDKDNGSDNSGDKDSDQSGDTESDNTNTDTEGFVRKETDTDAGWFESKIELADGTELIVDELDYAPKDERFADGVILDEGAVLAGDASIDGLFGSDDNRESGQATVNRKQGAIAGGKYGYAIYQNFDPSKTDLLLETIAENMKSDGCGLPTGCKTVDFKEYTEDGEFVTYKASSSDSSKDEQPSDTSSTDKENQHPADCQCTLCCTVVEQECTIPETPEEPEGECIPGYDHDLKNIYNGDLKKLKADVKNGKNTEYKVVVKPGEKVEIQGDVVTVENGKVKENFDNKSETGAFTTIFVPENGDAITAYIVFGGDVHKLNSCTSLEEAEALANQYIAEMKQTYGNKNVQIFSVK